MLESEHNVKTIPYMTGIVVSYNEAQRLEGCLSSLKFCSQLILVDLGSTDGTLEIASRMSAEIVKAKRVAIVEQIREEAVKYSSNDWIVFLDPDEVFPEKAIDEIERIIGTHRNLAAISLPWNFYFKGKRLKHTIWGNEKYKLIVFNRRKVKFCSLVHTEISVPEAYSSVSLSRTQDYSIKHYWADSYSQLFEKHRRYCEHEGKSLYFAGKRFSWIRASLDALKGLFVNLFTFRGLLGGYVGISLSLFYAYYKFASFLSLKSYEQESKTSEEMPS